MTPDAALKKAIELTGGTHRSLAKTPPCTFSRPALLHWIHKAPTLPPNRDLTQIYVYALQIEAATNYQVKAEWLCPNAHKLMQDLEEFKKNKKNNEKA